MLNLKKYTSKRSWKMYGLSIGTTLMGALATGATDSYEGLALGASASIILAWPLVSELLYFIATGYPKKTEKRKV